MCFLLISNVCIQQHQHHQTTTTTHIHINIFYSFANQQYSVYLWCILCHQQDKSPVDPFLNLPLQPGPLACTYTPVSHERFTPVLSGTLGI